MQGPNTGETKDPMPAKAELARLRVKLSENKDPDVRKALQERINQLEAEIPTEQAPEEEEEVIPPPPTPAQIAEADKLVRQARVEKMRNNTRESTELLKKASEVAPGAPAVLEVLGDDLMERKQYAQAKKAYKRAWQLDKSNVGLERKFALCVHQMDALGNFDAQMRMGDSAFGSEADAVASPTAAIWLSAMFPGLGHAVRGKRIGYLIMAAWVFCALWVFFMYEDLARIVGMAGGSTGTPRLTVLVPLLGMAVIYFATLASLSSSKKHSVKKKIDRPVPPVDKPFEI